MRGRNKPWAKDFIVTHSDLVYNKDEKLEFDELTLEIGIGKGDFIVQNAKANTSCVHIGVELNTSIFAIAMKKIVSEQLTNIRLLNTSANKLLDFITEGSINKIYLNFSDPWPQNGYRKRRLVHPIHLEIFEKLLKDGGQIIFKTDNEALFNMGVENFLVRNYDVIFKDDNYQLVKDDFMTEYETKFRAMNVAIHRAVAIVNKDKFHPWNDKMK